MLTTPRLIVIALCAALNFSIGTMVYLIKLPIYLDSIGTILCALLLAADRKVAFVCAWIAATLSLIVSALLINPFIPWFAGTDVAIALVSAFLTSRGVATFRARPIAKTAFAGRVVAYGIVTGLAAAVVSAPVVAYLFGGVTGSGSALVVAVFLQAGQQLLSASLSSGLTIEPIDKTLQVLLAALLYRATPGDFIAMLQTPYLRAENAMTPNGAIIFGLVVVTGAMIASGLGGLCALLALCAAFGMIETRDRMARAFAWSAVVVAPLVLFLSIVWIGVVGRSPAEIAAGASGTRTAALVHVAVVCLRLFVVASVIQLIVLRFAHMTPLQFIRAVRAPPVAKKLIVLTLSWIDTILHAVDRSRTALITAGLIAPRLSLKNAGNGWILVQTVWLSVVTIAIGRLRDKWPAENTLARLDEALHTPAQGLAWRDALWIAVAVVAVATPKVV
jgi:energy-coupling factor transport system substrate-specific component